MPKVSRFYGIEIELRFREANHSLPHFHAVYGEFEASIGIETLTVLAGHVPQRALELILIWANLHRAELLQGWNNAKAGQKIEKIAPLP